MNIVRIKPFSFSIFAVFVVAPLVSWLLVYVLVRYSLIDPNRLESWLGAARWATWIPAMALMLAAIANDNFHYLFVYGCGLLSFSAGLSFSESWLKKRLNLGSDQA
jgi:hypothetical protein